MKLIPLEDEGFLVEETVRQVCVNAQRFNVNMVMYNTLLIKGIMLIMDSTSLKLAINRHHERVAVWIR